MFDDYLNMFWSWHSLGMSFCSDLKYGHHQNNWLHLSKSLYIMSLPCNNITFSLICCNYWFWYYNNDVFRLRLLCPPLRLQLHNLAKTVALLNFPMWVLFFGFNVKIFIFSILGLSNFAINNLLCFNIFAKNFF